MVLIEQNVSTCDGGIGNLNINSLLLTRSLPNPEDADSMLAKEMSRLSVAEREAVLADIHGVSPVATEGADFVAKRMVQMEEQLGHIQDKDAYQRARSLSLEYVQNRKFRLAFLRADGYDPRLAAERLVRHFEQKLFLFGVRKLVHNITLDDLEGDDLLCLEKGNFMLSPIRKDRSGRVIVIFTFPINLPVDPVCKLRASWYFCSRLVEDDENTQLKGVVVIVRTNNDIVPPTPLVMQTHAKLMAALPVRISSMHYCICDPKLMSIGSLPRFYVDKRCLMRSRVHLGSKEENEATLQSFGIPPPAMSWVGMVDFLESYHRGWIAWRRSQEMLMQANDNGTVIVHPERFDVLYGRGRSRDHSGNLRIKSIVESYQEEYENANRVDKSVITNKIVQIIHETGGRFLRQNEEGGWVEVEDSVAREKVSKFFRKIRT